MKNCAMETIDADDEENDSTVANKVPSISIDSADDWIMPRALIKKINTMITERLLRNEPSAKFDAGGRNCGTKVLAGLLLDVMKESFNKLQFSSSTVKIVAVKAARKFPISLVNEGKNVALFINIFNYLMDLWTNL